MSNALSEEQKQQVIALGKLGWSLRRIERETGVRRETAGAYLKAAGLFVRAPGAWERQAPAKPATVSKNERGLGSLAFCQKYCISQGEHWFSSHVSLKQIKPADLFAAADALANHLTSLLKL